VTATDVEYYDLLQSLERFSWLKLPHDCMRECGPAAQTLGALLRISTRETFVTNSTIAETADLPVSTVKKHVAKLAEAGWIANRGRQRTAGGALRRTATRCATSRADRCERFGVLPVWLSLLPLRWSDRAVFSLVMGRALSVSRGVNKTEAAAEIESIEDLHYGGYEDRFHFSLSQIQQQTGLGRHPIVEAKRSLRTRGLIDWYSGDGGDVLIPSQRKAIKAWTEGTEDYFGIRKNPSYRGGV
jgi:hypothetical protein